MPQIDKKKIGLFLLVGVGVLFILLLLVLIFGNVGKGKGDGQPESTGSVEMGIPEGDAVGISDSRLDGYEKDNPRKGRRKIDEYWDAIAEVNPEEDPFSGIDNAGSGGESEGGKTVDDIFGKREAPEAAKQQPRGSQAFDEQAYLDQMLATRQKVYDSYIQNGNRSSSSAGGGSIVEMSEETPVERDKIDVNGVAVRRSGTVSSMDDGSSSFGSSGMSSLDSGGDMLFEDDDYPFKCMFVRQEKIRDGNRVSIRLLEDMVVNGQLVPKNTHLMATCQLGSRLDMNVSSIDLGGRIINLDYDAYDATDGVRGIFCPKVDDSIKNQVKRQGISTGYTIARSSVGRIAQDVLQAGSTILQSTGDDRYVSVPAGYQFYLVKSKRR